jgi:homocitrate synthase NifV
VIKIVDRTLSSTGQDADQTALGRFLLRLIETEVDFIELSEAVYRRLEPLPTFAGYVLRIPDAERARQYPELRHFVCRNAPEDADARVRAEALINDVREAYTIARFGAYGKVRLTGFADMLLGDYPSAFASLRTSFRADTEFCPTNRLGFATAMACEWAMSGGGSLVTSFGGVGGFAPTEEVVMALRLGRARKVGKTYAFFPEMAELLGEITGHRVRGNKPVLGHRIFHVESGIHVDGIVKQPKCYEPFPPEVVGRERRIVLGKHSGAASVRFKLAEMGISCDDGFVTELAEHVKSLAAEKNSALTNLEFVGIVRAVTGGADG